MKQIIAIAVILIGLSMCTIPAAAQTERGLEVNGFVGQGSTSASGTSFPRGTTFGVGAEYPVHQGEKFALNSSLSFLHASSGSLKSAGGNAGISQNAVGGGLIAYARPQSRLRPYGGFEYGYVGNKYSFGRSSQTRNASGMEIFCGFKFDFGKHIALGPRVGMLISSAYGYDSNGNLQRQSVRNVYYGLVFARRSGS